MTQIEKVKPKPVVVGVERSDGTRVVAEFDSSVIDYFSQRLKETSKEKVKPKCHKCGREAMTTPTVSGVYWCMSCAVNALDDHEEATADLKVYIGPEERRYHSLDDGSTRPEEHGQEWDGYNDDGPEGADE